MSSALPCARSERMSSSTTSARSCSTRRCATVAPTLPDPTMVTLCLMAAASPLLDRDASRSCLRIRGTSGFGPRRRGFSHLRVTAARHRADRQAPAGESQRIVTTALQVLDDRAGELGGLEQLGAFHLALEVVGDALL